MAKKSLDLTTLLPKQYRDKTIDSLIKNLFERHVSKADTVPLYGNIGDGDLDPGEIKITESSLERQINQITSLIYAEHATEKKVFSWPDLVQKMVLLGIDYSTIGEWFRSTSYNLMPPIDIDKFCNFNEYFWIGNWINPKTTKAAMTLPWQQLGLPAIQYVRDAFERTNPNYDQEYYTIRRSGFNSGDFSPARPIPNLNSMTWSDWGYTNLWVHKQDLIEFINQFGTSVSFSDLKPATRPIIEYYDNIRLNTAQNAQGEPIESINNNRIIQKTRANQPPLFDVYDSSGEHIGKASSLFYYVEGSQYPVDTVIQRRVATDKNNDFIFEHSLVNPDTKEMFFFKSWDGNEFKLRTIWTPGPEAGPRYVKYDTSGTLINQDKFTNYRNYYWAALPGDCESYNPTAEPQYVVIEKGNNISDWSLYNKWVHVSQLKLNQIPLYVQAERPIIEFNRYLEPELTSAKWYTYQLPTFNMYTYDLSVPSYRRLGQTSDPALENLNDAYLKGALIVRLDDLSDEMKQIVSTTSELMAKSFEYAGETYLQGLDAGMFVPSKDGNVYGYRTEVVTKIEDGKGEISPIELDTDCVPEVLTLTYDLATNLFNVHGSVSGQNPDLIPGSAYETHTGLRFVVNIGETPFEHEDKIFINVKGFIYQPQKVYVRVGDEYRTLDTPDAILSENIEVIKIDADPEDLDGVWEVPPQIELNAHNETRTQIKQGDLYFHLTSIIKEQPGLLGSETGNNNFRQLPVHNLGLGGLIKQYDGRASLLVSMLIQEDLSIPTVIEFARQSYESLFNTIRGFIEEKVPQMLTDAKFMPPTEGDHTIDPSVVSAFKNYFLDTANSKYPDFVKKSMQSVFSDSTSPIKGMVVTLPYLGLCPTDVPRKVLDLELNIPMMVHHDGHRTRLTQPDKDLMKQIVTKRFTRTLGQESAGFVSAVDFPKDPFKGQFWFQTSTSKLFFYNVVSETGELPDNALIGSYSVDRDSTRIWQYNGEWVQLGYTEMNLPWTEVRLDLIEQNLILALETELYKNCPPVTTRLNLELYHKHDNFLPNMKKELERFGVIYGTPDVYSSAYNSANPFTWNYISLTGEHEVWQEIYRAYYGTPRPDLQPWIPAGYPSEAEMMADLISLGFFAGSVQTWKTYLWTLQPVSDYLRQQYINVGRPGYLCVDLNTGSLLPPYSIYPDGLFKEVPVSASEPFHYGGMGPVEMYWRKTLNYRYSLQKTYFKINPLDYLKNTWGIRYDTVGNYVLNRSLGRKEAPKDFQLHGDPVPVLTEVETIIQNQKINTQMVATIINHPDYNRTYEITCVNRIDNLFSVKHDGNIIGFMQPGVVFTDEYIAFFISPRLDTFYWGDSFTVDVKTEGVPAITNHKQSYIQIEGLNQLYVQYRRLYGEDANLSINQTLLKDWVIRAGYRFGSLVNTDTLVIKNQNEVMDPSTYQILIKENKFYDSAWLNALRIQLVQKGSVQNGVPRVGPGGTPGEDWVFRVDNFNDSRTELSWYTLDKDGPSTNFLALDGKKSLHQWTHYERPLNIVSHFAPFLIRGMQNVVDFLYGYAAKLEADGWRFNDQENPVLDATTGRPVGFQLLIEQFIAQQFNGVDAGSSFVVNPFSRKVWFATPHGVVSDMFSPLGIERELVPSVLDQNQRPVPRSSMRIFRQDETTQFVFDQPVYTLHALVSEYEHVALFNDYTFENILLNDSFIGQRANKIFFSGEKQATFTGRLDLGGHYVFGDQMKRNIENSVSSILKMYDTSGNPSQTPDVEQARSLLGFKKKQYFEDRGSTDATEFRFWQGMIANKGTNFAVDAYVNSSQYQSAKLDEYWAYKLAEYGDAREIKRVELRLDPEDCTSEITKYLFLEEDELNLIREYKRNGGFDISNLGINAYDVATLYTEIQSIGFDYVDPIGCTIIRPDDESRWFRYDDLKAMQYFESVPIAEYTMVATDMNKLYQIYDEQGKRVRADCFEIVDMSDPEQTRYYEMGPISDSNPFDMDDFDTNRYDQLIQTSEYPEYEEPLFKRLNHYTIQITNPLLLNKPLKVVAYGPAFARYSPSDLIDHRSNVSARDDVIWWDPARGIHHPQAINEVDYVQPKNPAKYNQSLVTFKNPSVELMKPWGEEHVGKLWWNTNGLEYQPYSDAKIVHDMNDRVAQWGAVSDASSVEVYEWVESLKHPADYDVDPASDGNAAFKDVVTRTRTWYQRPVAWKFSSNPLRQQHTFSAYQPSRLRFEVLNGINGRAVLNTGDFISILDRGCKIAGAVYNSQEKTDVQLASLFGTAKITSDPYVVVGSQANYTSGAKFTTNPYFALAAELDYRVLNFRRKNYLGQYKLSGEQDGNDFFVRLTHVDSGETQQLRAQDLPILANTQTTYNFDKFGVIILCTSKMARADLIGMNESTRLNHVILSIGLAHEIYLRSSVDVEIMIPFAPDEPKVFFLDGMTDVTRNGWVGWEDPVINPLQGLEPPLNRYQPFVGPWTPVEGHLADVADDIRTRINDPWTWFDGRNFNPYKGVWSPWTKVQNTVYTDDYNPVNKTHDTYIMEKFTFPKMLQRDLKARATIYINEVALLPAQWTTATRTNGPYVVGAYPKIPALNPGDRIKLVLRPLIVSEEDLKFDPDVEDNIFKLTQYKIDYPHVLEERRDQNDRKTHKYYYFWVKNKLTPSKIKRMSSSRVADLLHHHEGVYEIPQIFKQYNQVDGRPNRYGLIAIKGLSQYVTETNMYKMRFTDNGTLRHTDDDMSLKNRHVEWVLLRANQATKIPRTLWDKLTDTMIGRSADGRLLLPFTPLEKYDARNGSSDRFGFGDGQVMNDVYATIATVKHVIQNTRVDKYEGTVLVPDYISYDGFDINNLDNYFFEPQSGDVDETRIRQFMSDLWRFAKPKQVNEIFFAVLEDTAARNLELSNFFKTSFISIGEIRTIN